MQGQEYNPLRTQLKDAGAGDVLVQVVEGSITFKKVGGKSVRVFPLAINGARGEPMELAKAEGSAGALDLSKGRSLVYEVAAE